MTTQTRILSDRSQSYISQRKLQEHSKHIFFYFYSRVFYLLMYMLALDRSRWIFIPWTLLIIFWTNINFQVPKSLLRYTKLKKCPHCPFSLFPKPLITPVIKFWKERRERHADPKAQKWYSGFPSAALSPQLSPCPRIPTLYVKYIPFVLIFKNMSTLKIPNICCSYNLSCIKNLISVFLVKFLFLYLKPITFLSAEKACLLPRGSLLITCYIAEINVTALTKTHRSICSNHKYVDISYCSCLSICSIILKVPSVWHCWSCTTITSSLT